MNAFKATQLNRAGFWLNYIGLFVALFVVAAIIGMIAGPGGEDDWVIDVLLRVAFVICQFRLLYLRAVDVGYPRPGHAVAVCLIPLVGFFQALSIMFLPTGARRPSAQAIAEQAVGLALAA